MRMTIAASALALLAADAAVAQRMVQAGPGVTTTAVGGGYGSSWGGGYNRGSVGRWGSNVNGRWWAGANAPGGWNAYRRPHRGWTLPSYWVAPSFAVADWSTYGLGAPPAGYSWTRYYDDAVLIDGNGRIYDDVGGVDWNRGGYDAGYDASYAAQGPYAGASYAGADYAAPGYVQPTYGQSTYAPAAPYAPPAPAYAPPPPAYAPGATYPAPAYAERRSNGVGGALIGAGVGAVAGNVIAGRGNRLAGTLIGAGVGGAAGYAIDRSSSRRVPVAPRYGAGYGYPPAAGYDYAPSPGYAVGAGYPPPPPPPPPPPGVGPAGVWHSPDGGTVVTTTSAGGYYGGSTTTVTVQTAPVVTTTTTEIVEDNVTYVPRHRAPARHKWIRRTGCGC